MKLVKALTIGRFLGTLATISLVAAPVAAQAQDAANPLGIPADVSILRQNDPNSRKPTAVVNGSVITGTDVDQRVALVTAASQGQLPPEEMARLRMQVLRNLIDETLQIQEAAAQEIEVTQADVDARYADVASRNFGADTKAMDAYLASVGSSPAALKRQIQGEIAWQRLLGRNVTPFINVSDEEVREVLKRLEESRGSDEYRVGEIFLSSTPETHGAVGENAVRIVEQLRQGGSFVAYARQFSEATTAAVGGDLGWIRLPQLQSPQLEAIVREMQPGQLQGPVEIPGGFWIVYLIDRRKVLMADPRDAVLSLKQVAIGFPAGISEADATARIDAFNLAVQSIRGCGDVERAAETVGADVVTNDEIKVGQLPPQLQNAMLQMQVGEATPLFGSVEDGVRTLVLCGRDDPQTEGGPDFDTMLAQLEDERINKRAQRYLRDLRSDAFIEYN
ncbi:MAG: peptidylprolyl isomerase [Sphingomonadaceae bacterium]|nr:peptidylprolyl isomerase [Sphingomonadaceae bacterium]